MKFEEHCFDCQQHLGEPFPQVHKWLDEFFIKLGPKHRRLRHHQAGVDEVHRKWGARAAEAARLHIKADLELEGWIDGLDPFPRNEDDYVAQGQLWNVINNPE